MSITVWIRGLATGTNRTHRSSRPASRSRYYRPRLESLEDRSLLSAFATFQGELAAPKEKDVIPIRVNAADFSMYGRTVLLGFEMHARDGGLLDPGHIQVQTRGRYVAARPSFSSNRAGQASVTLATVRTGSFQLLVSGDRRTTGAYQVDAFLVGDANGDNRVDKSDERLIHVLRGKRLGNPAYVEGADANRDGVINEKDETLARTNRGAATRIRPLTLSAAVDPASLPDGVQPGAQVNVIVVGQTLPLATVKLDQSGDGSFEQTGTADDQGHYQFTVGVSAGTTPFHVQARGPFSQHFTTDLDVIIPLATPGQLDVRLDEDHAASAVITTVGGTVSTTGLDGASYSLVLPSGALANDQTISLTPVAAIDNLPLSGGLVAAVQFAPDGLQFTAPATLTIDVPAAFDTNGLFGFTYDADGTNLQIVPVQAVGHTLIMQVSHFSGAGAATGSALEALYMPLIRQAQQPVIDTVCAGGLIPNACDADDDTALLEQGLRTATVPVFKTWFVSGVQPLLNVAANSDAGLDNALYEFLVWQGKSQSFLCDGSGCSAFFNPAGFQTFVNDSRATLTTALKDGINRTGTAAVADPSVANLRRLLVLAAVERRFSEGQAPLADEKLDLGLRELLKRGQRLCTTDALEGQALLERADLFSLYLGDALEEDFISALQGCGITIQPTHATVVRGGQVQFSATVSPALGLGSNNVAWEVIPSAVGTIDASGLFTAGGQSTGTFQVKAISAAEPNKFAVASVEINSLLTVTVSPTAAILQPGGSSQFSATVTGSIDNNVIWSATGGTITQTGLFTAGQNPGTFEVKATSTAPSAEFATVSVTVLPTAGGITISPSPVTLPPGGAQQFTANVTGLTNQDVTWTATGGTITPTGLFTAGTTAGAFQVTAASVATPTLSSSATVTVFSLLRVGTYTSVTSEAVLLAISNTLCTNPGISVPSSLQWTMVVAGGPNSYAITLTTSGFTLTGNVVPSELLRLDAVRYRGNGVFRDGQSFITTLLSVLVESALFPDSPIVVDFNRSDFLFPIKPSALCPSLATPGTLIEFNPQFWRVNMKFGS